MNADNERQEEQMRRFNESMMSAQREQIESANAQFWVDYFR